MATEEEVLKKMRKWILEENKSVGSRFLLRNTKLNGKEINSVLQKFYEDEKLNTGDLTASYIVFGKATSNNNGDGTRAIMRSLICTEKRLPEVCKSFSEVSNKAIFSIQRGSLSNLHRPLNNIYAGRIPNPVVDMEDRLNIIDETVVNEMSTLRKMNKIDLSDIELPLLQTRLKRGPKVFVKKIIVKRDQHSLREAFAKGEKLRELEEEIQVVNEFEIESNVKRPARANLGTPQKSAESEKSKIGKLKPSNDKKPKKQDKKKGTLMFETVEKEDGYEEDEEQYVEINNEVGSEEEETIPTKKQLRHDGFDDDLFSTEDDVKGSVLQEEEPRPSKTKSEELDEAAPTKRRRIVEPNDEDVDNEESHTEENRIVKEVKQFKPVKYKKEEITEEFVDEEGMLVTRTITKIVKEDPVGSDEMPTTSSKPKPILKPSNSSTSKGPKKAPTGQPTISSFFTKK